MDELKCTALALNEDETAHALIYSRMGRGAALLGGDAYPMQKNINAADWAARDTLQLVLGDETAEVFGQKDGSFPAALDALLDDAVERGVLKEDTVTYRDLLDTRLMGILTPRPSQVIGQFRSLYRQAPEKATDWYYQFSQDTNYIRRDRIARDVQWKVETEYGQLDITINLSKPEKDPKAIAAARNLPASAYPRCQLCAENEGYAGRVNHPARQNHRIIPITINGSPWYLQYSPYVYYNEHCICLNREHTPMKIDRACFGKLLDFVRQFPHYFVGSNADLPIVGGSILAHDHFQGGRYTFAMERASVETPFTFPGYEDVCAGIVKWPMSVVRLTCADPERLIDLADKILLSWRSYTDREAMILASQEGTLKFRVPGETDRHRAVVGLGIVQVANNRVTVVVDTAERPEDIDQVRARQALERAKEQLRQKQSIREYHMSRASMARALSRLKASQQKGGHYNGL